MKLTSREKRFVLAGILVVAGVLIFYAITKLPQDSGDISDNADFKRKMLLRQRETITLEETYKKRLEQYARAYDQSMTRLLPGDNPSVAGAELHRILKELADQSGVEITQKNTLPEKKVQGADMLTKVSVNIQTNCDPDQLVQFLSAIKNYEKLLKVEDLTIASFPIQRRYVIRPSLTVVGYIISKESKPAEKSAGGNIAQSRSLQGQ